MRNSDSFEVKNLKEFDGIIQAEIVEATISKKNLEGLIFAPKELNTLKPGQKFSGKMYLYDKSIILASFEVTDSQKILVFNHSHLPDGTAFEIKSIKSIQDYSQTEVLLKNGQKLKGTLVSGMNTTDKTDTILKIENLVPVGFAYTFTQSDVAEIKKRKIDTPDSTNKKNEKLDALQETSKKTDKTIDVQNEIEKKTHPFEPAWQVKLSGFSLWPVSNLAANFNYGLGANLAFARLQLLPQQLHFLFEFSTFHLSNSNESLTTYDFEVGIRRFLFYFDRQKNHGVYAALSAGFSVEQVHTSISETDLVFSSSLFSGYQVNWSHFGLDFQATVKHHSDRENPLWAFGFSFGLFYKM